MLRSARAVPDFASLEPTILSAFPVHGNFQLRRTEEDPRADDFDRWAEDRGLVIPPQMRSNDYAGCIFRDYRNAVVHELQVARGREALLPVGPYPEGIFYSNHSSLERHDDPIAYIRFGVAPAFLLNLLREAIESLRTWARDTTTDIFSERNT